MLNRTVGTYRLHPIENPLLRSRWFPYEVKIRDESKSSGTRFGAMCARQMLPGLWIRYESAILQIHLMNSVSFEIITPVKLEVTARRPRIGRLVGRDPRCLPEPVPHGPVSVPPLEVTQDRLG